MNTLQRWFANRSAIKIFKGRERCNSQPEKGRFSESDIKKIMEDAWAHYDMLLPTAPRYQRPGNRGLMKNGVLSLALYRAFVEAVEDREYATRLCGDFLWKFYEMSMKGPAALARLVHRDRKKQLNFLCSMGVKYRFSPPAYAVETRFEDNSFFMDFYRCPICDYFRDQGEEELAFFRNTWCRMDWAVIETMVKGPVRYERTTTLSDGDEVCDMRWIVEDRL